MINEKYEREFSIKILLKTLMRKMRWIIIAGIIMSLLVVIISILKNGSSIFEETKSSYESRSDYQGTAILYLGEESTVATVNAAITYLRGTEMIESLFKEVDIDIEKSVLLNNISILNPTDNQISINIYGLEEDMVYDVTEYLSSEGIKRLKSKVSEDIVLLEPAHTILREYNVEMKYTVKSFTMFIKTLSKNIIIGFILGAFVITLVYVFLYIINDRIMDESDVVGYLNVPVLGSIPTLKNNNKSISLKNRLKARF